MEVALGINNKHDWWCCSSRCQQLAVVLMNSGTASDTRWLPFESYACHWLHRLCWLCIGELPRFQTLLMTHPETYTLPARLPVAQSFDFNTASACLTRLKAR
jgi:hypothetical protein